MQLNLTCKDCGRTIQVVDEPSASRLHTCTHCGKKIKLPSNILNSGHILGGFEIEKHLGCGSMGSVYLARQLSMDRQVAIKVLPEERCNEEAYKNDFLDEIKMLGKLDHPNIVTALESGEQDGVVFVAMRYVPGKTLDEIIESDGSVNEDKALQIAVKLSEALRFAWQHHGLLHRDIKPANIILDQHKEPILLDLGLHKVYGDDENEEREGKVLGTPFYMSPEQAYAPKEIDCRSDIYSLGCTLFHALTGCVPFDGKDVYDVLAKHRLSPIPSPQNYNVEISDECCELLAQMMAKNPAKRHSSWTDLIAHLKATLDPRPVTNTGLPALDPLSQEEIKALREENRPGDKKPRKKANGKKKQAEPRARESDSKDHTTPAPENEALNKAKTFLLAKYNIIARAAATGCAAAWKWIKRISLKCRDRLVAVQWKKHAQTGRTKIVVWSKFVWKKICKGAAIAKVWLQKKWAICRTQLARVDWEKLPAKSKERLAAVQWEKLPAIAKKNPAKTGAILSVILTSFILFVWFLSWLFSGTPAGKPIVVINNGEGKGVHGNPSSPGSPALPDIGRSNYTLMFWFKTSQDGVLFTKSGPTWGERAKAIYIKNGRVCFACGKETWVGNQSVFDHETHHIALVGGSNVLLYLDNKLERRIKRPLPGDLEGATMRFGFSPEEFDHNALSGVLDEIQLYDLDLSDEQMEQMGVELKWSANTPKPLLNWSFGPGTGPKGLFKILVHGKSSFSPGRYRNGLKLNGNGHAEVSLSP